MNYSNTITDLEVRLFGLHPDVKELYSLIVGLKAQNPVNPNVVPVNFINGTVHNLSKYNRDKPVAWKIKFALHQLQKLSKVSDIQDVIRTFEQEFNKGLSTPLTKLKDEGIIKSYNPTGSMRDVYYGFKNWFNEDGSFKEDFFIKE